MVCAHSVCNKVSVCVVAVGWECLVVLCCVSVYCVAALYECMCVRVSVGACVLSDECARVCLLCVSVCVCVRSVLRVLCCVRAVV